MLVDSHCHIFTNRIVENVRSKPQMVEELKLGVGDAPMRLAVKALQESAEANGVDVCLLLPSASPDKVRSENERFYEWSVRFSRIRTLGTLHPAMKDLSSEAVRMLDTGIKGIKLSSFSQRFDPLSSEAEKMSNELERLGHKKGVTPTLVLDTFARADIHFGASTEYLTTPYTLAQLARRHPGLNIVGAHMGGLLADFDDMRRHLTPAPNLYLDTANAAHTLGADQFTELLQAHGALHILFGTDWPWFVHSAEMPKVESLLQTAGFNQSEREAVFGENARRLFDLRSSIE
jgi:uncharacterized protein